MTIHTPSLVLEDRRLNQDSRVSIAALCEITEAHMKLPKGLPPIFTWGFVGVRKTKSSDFFQSTGFAIDAAKVNSDDAAARIASFRLERQDETGGQVVASLWRIVSNRMGEAS